MEFIGDAGLVLAIVRSLVLGLVVLVLLRFRGQASFQGTGFHITLVGFLALFAVSVIDATGSLGPPLVLNVLYIAATLVLGGGILAWVTKLRANDRSARSLADAEAGHRELLDRFNTGSELSGVWLWETNEKDELTYVSDVVEKIGGYPTDQYIGKHPNALPWLEVEPNDRGWVREKFFARQAYSGLKYNLLRADGERRRLSLDGSPMFSTDGVFRGYRGVGRDITVESATRKALKTISEGLGDSTGEDYLHQLVERLSEASQFEYVFIGRMRTGGDKIEVVSGIGEGRQLQGFDYDIAVSPCREVVGKSTFWLPEGVADAYPDDHWLAEWGFEGYLGVPLSRRDGTPIGVVACLSRQPITNVDIAKQLAESFADRAALELERRQIQYDLLDERNLLREALKMGRMGYYYSHATIDQVEWSDSLFYLAGLEPREITLKEVGTMIHPDDLQGFLKARQDAIDARKSYQTEVRVFLPNGDIVWWALTGNPKFDDDGNVLNIFGIVQDVTARKKTELALQEAQQSVHDAFQELRSAINALPFSIVIYDKDLRSIIRNDAYRDLLGYTAEEMWQQETLMDLIRFEVEEKKSFGDRTAEEVFAEVTSKMDKTKPYYGREFWQKRQVHIERRIAPLPSGGWIFALIDITDLQNARKELEDLNAGLEQMVVERTRQLQASEERYRDIAQTSADRFWELDSDLRIVSMSDSFAEFDSEMLKEIIGKPIADFLKEREVNEQDFNRVMSALKRHKPFRQVPMARVVDGVRQHLVVSGNPFFEGGEFAGYRGSSSDVTPLRMAQQELMEAEKLASLGRLVAGVAHDVNTPVGNALTVSSSLEDTVVELQALIADGKLSRQRFNEFLDRLGDASSLIRSNLERGAKLIRNFKQVAVDQTSENRRKFDVAGLIDEVVTTLQPLFKGNKISISMELQENTLMNSYPGPLGQVVSNLVENAVVHAFPEGTEGSIRIFADAIDDGRVRIRVRDDGRGVPPELQSRIFEPFFTTRLNSGGSGLGLTIVHNIVTGVLGGTIDIESEEGQGTTTVIFLPATAPETVATPELETEEA